jgi:hypothetical protein
MSKKSITKITAIAFSLALFFLISAFAKPVVEKPPAHIPPKADCSQITDGDIVKALYDKIKADSNLSGQLSHINISVKDKTVTIEGWVSGKDRKKAVEKLAKKTECVKKVKNRLFTHLTTGCGPGQKPCGDICIDKNSDCTIGN